MVVIEPADGDGALAVPVGASRRRRVRWPSWLGLVPFLAFLFVFLLLPAYGVVRKAIVPLGGERLTWSAMADAWHKENGAFDKSIRLSLLTALLGSVFGTALAYAVATTKRPKWLRSLATSFSGVAANMGGVVLAFAFITLLGAQGLGTKILKTMGWDLYSGKFTLGTFAGWVTVYLYFQIPLMVLVTLPAIDGLKPAWREASANLGGTTWTFWRRVGLPVLAPSILGGFMLLFANSFSAFATAYALNTGSQLVPVKIAYYLQGDIGGRSATPYALATWMIIVMAVAMGGYLALRKRAERWRS